MLDWRVPLRAGAATAQVTGTLDWVPPPHPDRWWMAVLLLAAAIAALGLVRTATGTSAMAVRVGLTGLAVAVGSTTAGYPLLVVAANAEPPAGSVAATAAGQAVPLLVVLAVIAAGGLVWGRRPVADFAVAPPAAVRR